MSKDLVITSILTLTVFIYDVFSDVQRKTWWYMFYFCMILFLLWGSNCSGEVFIKEDGVTFEMMSDIPSRDELIMKMIEHKRGHDKALMSSVNCLKRYKLYQGDVEELYRAAFSAVSTYAGCRNFILPAVVAIIEYVSEQSWKTLKWYEEYSKELNIAEYHAEMFDFYMTLLRRYYHK